MPHERYCKWLFKLTDAVFKVQIGPVIVVQIITDNAAACKAAGQRIEALYPHITWSGCVAHAMDLCLEDIGKSEWAVPILKQGRDIVKFISNHHKSLALFRDQSILNLLRPADTRFATTFITHKRLSEVRPKLEATVTSQGWRDWLGSTSSVRPQGEAVKLQASD
jgi:hypothetical protein